MRKNKRVLWWLVAGAVGVALVAWSLRPEVVVVETTEVRLSPLQVTIDEDGVTRVAELARIAAPLSGRLSETPLEPGDSVEKGAIVGRISPVPLDRRTRAELEAAIAGAQAQVVAARAAAQQVRVLVDEAGRARERATVLEKAGALAKRDLEDADALLRVRKGELEVAQARETSAIQDERRLRASLMSADPLQSVGPTGVLLRSPISGRVLRVFEEHDRVVAAGTPLVEVGDPTSLEVVSDVLSSDAMAIVPGMRMLVRVPGRDVLSAQVTRVEPAAFTKLSPLGVEEQRVNVIGCFLQEAVGLGDGFEVDVSIVLWESGSVLTAPATALVPVDSGWGVYVMERGRARLRTIEVGRRGVREVEVRSGLSVGDLVIRHPDERVVEGARVR